MRIDDITAMPIYEEALEEERVRERRKVEIAEAIDDIERPKRVALQIEAQMIRVEQSRAAAERLGLTARAAEYAAQIETLRGKLAKIEKASEGGVRLAPSEASPEKP